MRDGNKPGDRTDSAISIAVEERDGRTYAKADLRWAGRQLAGTGIAYRHPSDYLISEVGADLATARALADLGDQLLALPRCGVDAGHLTLVR